MADLPEETPMTDDLKKRVLDNLDALDKRGKLRVLDFSSELVAREPSRKVGETGGALLAFAGSIPKEDLDEMEKVIEEEFENVNPDEWQKQKEGRWRVFLPTPTLRLLPSRRKRLSWKS